MNKADEMFEKLGYISCRDERNIYYNKRLTNYNTKVIHFKEFIETIAIYLEDVDGKMIMTDSITMQELQAINEKVKELGWND